MVSAKPPFRGTVFVAPNTITDKDPTSFLRAEKAGTGERVMFDRRARNFIKLEAHLFKAFFDDEKTIEVQVNPEFSAEEALEQALRYLPAIGQIPGSLRSNVKTVWIHKGDYAFGGGNRNLLIHTARGEAFIKQGVLAETFLHEGTHTSLDAHHIRKPAWLTAQEKDPEFISSYARQNPHGEDFAESFTLYFALRYKPGRVDDEFKNLLRKTMPNRIAYFDTLELDLHPVRKNGDAAKKDSGKKGP